MKRKRYTESQIIGILKEAEQGVPVTDLGRKHGMSNATFYTWRRKYAGMNVAEAKRLKQLEDENRRLNWTIDSDEELQKVLHHILRYEADPSWKFSNDVRLKQQMGTTTFTEGDIETAKSRRTARS